MKMSDVSFGILARLSLQMLPTSLLNIRKSILSLSRMLMFSASEARLLMFS